MRISTLLVCAALFACAHAACSDSDENGHRCGTGNDVVPRVRCECRLSATRGKTEFEYTNSFSHNVTLQAGTFRNYMTPGPAAGGQPSVFAPGTHRAHTIELNCTSPTNGAAWVVQQSHVASAHAQCIARPCGPGGECMAAPAAWSLLGPVRGGDIRYIQSEFYAQYDMSNTVVREIVVPASKAAPKQECRLVMRESEIQRSCDGAPYESRYHHSHPASLFLGVSALYMAVHPADPSTVYALFTQQGMWRPSPSAAEAFAKAVTIVKSADYGATWTKVYENPVTFYTYFYPTCLEVTASGAVFVGIADLYFGSVFGALRSLDGGATWTSTMTSISPQVLVNDIKAKPGTPSTLYAAGLDYVTFSKFFFVSTDNGASWTTTSDASWLAFASAPFNSIKLAVSAVEPAKVWFVVQGLTATNEPGDLVATGFSAASGAAGSWTVNTAPTTNVFSFSPDTFPGVFTFNLDWTSAFVAGKKNELYIGGAGVFKSLDNGLNWFQLDVQLIGTRTYNYGPDLYLPERGDHIDVFINDIFSVGPSNKRIVATTTNAFYETRNGGVAWQHTDYEAEVLALYDIGTGRVDALTVHPTEPHTVYACSSQGLWESLDDGANWRDAGGDCEIPGAIDMGVSAQNANKMYAYRGAKWTRTHPNGVYVTLDRGVHWTRTAFITAAPEAGYVRTAFRLIVDPSNDAHVLVSNLVGIYRTINSGASWTLVKATTSIYYVQDLKFKPGNSSVVYAMASRLLISHDNGATWPAEVVPDVLTIEPPAILETAYYSETFDLSGPVSPVGLQVNPAAPPSRVSAPIALTTNLNGTPLVPGAFVGKIAAIPRGTFNFAVKIANAQAAGAIGVIVANNAAGIITMDMGGATGLIPAVLISGEFANALVPLLFQQANVTATIVSSALEAPGLTSVRGVIAVTPQDPEFVYVMTVRSATRGLKEIMLSRDSGATLQPIMVSDCTKDNELLGIWTRCAPPAGIGLVQWQGFYDLAIAVNPENKYDLYVGGMLAAHISVPPSAPAAPVTFELFNLLSGVMHVDVQALAFVGAAGAKHLVVANDGGLYRTRTTNAHSGLNHANYNFRTRQGPVLGECYSISVSQQHRDWVVLNMQDNGNRMRIGATDAPLQLVSNDGIYSLFDYMNNSIIYTSSQFGPIARNVVTPAGVPVEVRFLNNTQSPLFYWKAFALHAATPTTLYAAVNDPTNLDLPQLFVSNNSGTSWQRVGAPMIPVAAFRPYRLVTTRANVDALYVILLAGTAAALPATTTLLAASPDGGATWYDVTGPTNHVEMLAVSNVNSLLVYAVESTGASTGKVWRSTDGGASWSDVTANLPAFYVLSVLIDDTYASTGESVYIGMEGGGVWNLKIGASTQWTPLDLGIVRGLDVIDLGLYEVDRVLRAGTRGRSVWEITLDDCAGCVAPSPLARSLKRSAALDAPLLRDSYARFASAHKARDFADEHEAEEAAEALARAERVYLRTSPTFLAREHNETLRIAAISALYPRRVGESGEGVPDFKTVNIVESEPIETATA
jgi:hypothetical protein